MTSLRRRAGARMGRATYVALVSAAILWFCGTVILFHVQATRAGLVSRAGLVLTAQLAGYVCILVVAVLSARRLRDLDASPWWSLAFAVPYLGVVLYLVVAVPYLWFFPGSSSPNRYGEAVKRPSLVTVLAAVLGPLLVLCGLFVLRTIIQVDGAFL
jgi:uncharacterized membrane protein YhaH (DUF805 family)